MGSLFYERIVKFSTQKTVYYFGRYGGLSRNGSFGDIPGHGASLTYRGLLVLWILKSNLVLSIRMSFTGHKKVSISRVQWSEMPTGKTVLLSVIFPGSNVSSMLDAIVVVAVSHNFPTREKQFTSYINNLCQVQRVSFSSDFSLGCFFCRFLRRWRGGKLVIQRGLSFLLAVNFLFLRFIRQYFEFIFTLSTQFYLLDNFLMDITSRSIFPDMVKFPVISSQFSSSTSSFNLKVSVTYNMSFCSFSNNFSFFFFFIPI